MENILLVGSLLLLLPFVIQGKDKDKKDNEVVKQECRDHYPPYCKVMTPDKCFLGYNKKLCCDTCTQYIKTYSTTDKLSSCPYPDRHWKCMYMDSYLCYNIYNRHKCCPTCAARQTELPECRYGDRDYSTCRGLESHDCYDENTKFRCCETCNKFYTSRKDCEYGDRRVFYMMQGKLYTCRDYTSHFGFSRCLSTVDPYFSRVCCQTCYEFFSHTRASRSERGKRWRRFRKYRRWIEKRKRRKAL